MCNNGGSFTRLERDGLLVPGPFDADRYRGGSIQRIERDGTLGDLYINCAGRPLRSPNDLVMDGHGGFYFTDFGTATYGARTADLGAIFYARCDGPASTSGLPGAGAERRRAERVRRCTTPRPTPAGCSAVVSSNRVCSS